MSIFLSYFDKFIDKNFVQGFAIGLFFYLITLIPAVRRLFSFVIPNLRYLKVLLTRRKYVLIWNDDSIHISEKIADLIKSECPKFRYKELKTADELLRYPINPKTIKMVILIVTDVTKLSEIEKRRKRMQMQLSRFVREGGTLFGTHDLIYRRCRNRHLQHLFGCEVCNFQRVKEPIKVMIQPEYANHPLLTGIPSEFELDDGEVCWGDWEKDARILIKTTKRFHNHIKDKAEYVPMTVIRHIGKNGVLIWMNSADKADKLPMSLSEPQTNVVKVMANAINYSEQIREYYKTHHH